MNCQKHQNIRNWVITSAQILIDTQSSPPSDQGNFYPEGFTPLQTPSKSIPECKYVRHSFTASNFLQELLQSWPSISPPYQGHVD